METLMKWPLQWHHSYHKHMNVGYFETAQECKDTGKGKFRVPKWEYKLHKTWTESEIFQWHDQIEVKGILWRSKNNIYAASSNTGCKAFWKLRKRKPLDQNTIVMSQRRDLQETPSNLESEFTTLHSHFLSMKNNTFIQLAI